MPQALWVGYMDTDQKTMEIASWCQETADMLQKAAIEAGYDEGAPGYLRDMLLRLYYAIRLEEKIGICADALTEETDSETVDTVLSASSAVDKASDLMFEQVESYTVGDDNFAAEIDTLALSDKADGMMDLLKKLYKCEGIIRMAYRCCARYPIYGVHTIDDADVRDNEDIATESVELPENDIAQKMGVDIDNLYIVRQKLMGVIEAGLPGGDA